MTGNSSHRTPTLEALAAMEQGEHFTKIYSSSSRSSRFIKLAKDHLTLHFTYRGCFGATKRRIVDLKHAELRIGHMTEVWQTMRDKAPNKEKCFSLLIEGKDNPINLVAASKEVAQIWILGIQHLTERIEHLNVEQRQNLWVWEYFNRADKDGSGDLSKKEIKSLLGQLNFKASDSYIRQILREVDTSQDQVLSISEFTEFFRKISWRDDIERLYKSLCEEDMKLQPIELAKFLNENLGYEVSTESAIRLIQKFEPDSKNKRENVMSTCGFMYLLLSEHGDIFDLRCKEVYQDMSQPLAHYFIASSHNTYLVDHQLYGESSAESYVRALDKGCRCVELDCWDGDDDEPVIYHGHTLTSKIKFELVIKTLMEFAFKKNPYPLILSIENHCCVEQQHKMAVILKNILGNSLLMASIREDEDVLPSPNDLLGKFIVKGKKLPSAHCNVADYDGEVTDEDEAADIENEEIAKKTKNKKSKLKLSSQLSDLVIYTQSRHFSGFHDAQQNSTCVHISSLNEDKATDLCKAEPESFNEHNKFQLVRIYPKGTRTDSSNYNPVPFWNTGCQIVALNYQTMGKPMRLNLARFRDNGGCGYVLRPMHQLSNEHFNPYFIGDRDGVKITIRVISAQQLPKPEQNSKGEVIDPYIKISIIGCDCDEQSERTSTVKNNGFNPTWDGEDPLVFKVKMPGLAIINFAVFDDDLGNRDEDVGQCSLPVSCLGKGYRHIHLENKECISLQPASIFVHITIESFDQSG